MLSPKNKRFAYRIIPFGLIWLLSGWVFLLVELAATGSFSELPATAIQMDFQIFLLSSLAITAVGLLIGFIELKYLDHVFSNKKFALRLFYKLLIYSLIFFLVIFVTFPVAASLELNTHLLDTRVWHKYFNYLVSVTHLSTAIQLATALLLSLFYSEISEFAGQNVLLNFFIGKYHVPREEERIFMFLDMKSSTTIAEKLGHLEYFKLLREYYNCFSDAIIQYEGEIYQYVGDEIILSWKIRSARSDNRCLNCFFAMKENLRRREDWFREQFGLVPTFKAGIHLGKVTTGEIGIIKKDILFTGDVLNATARIQGLCNTYDVDLIISADLVKQLGSNLHHDVKFLGKVELRGKQEKKELFTLLSN